MAFQNNLIASNAVAITPSDSAFVNLVGLYVGGAGNVTVKCSAGGAAVTFTAPPVGTIIPLQIVQVMATDTTATLLVGFTA